MCGEYSRFCEKMVERLFSMTYLNVIIYEFHSDLVNCCNAV